MITAKIKRWGNSIGVLIPKKEALSLNLNEDEEVVLEISKKENPLKELFGAGKTNKITKKEFIENRRMLEESRW